MWFNTNIDPEQVTQHLYLNWSQRNRYNVNEMIVANFHSLGSTSFPCELLKIVVNGAARRSENLSMPMVVECCQVQWLC